MALEFKKINNKIEANSVEMSTHIIGLPFQPIGMPMGVPQLNATTIIRRNVDPPPLALPGSDLPRALNYLADYSGCGWWRCGAPELLLNYGGKMIINSLTTMVTDPRFYLSGFKAIKMQRQATPIQKEFVKMIKTLGKDLNFRVIYEVDDIVFHEDIPTFNRCRGPFTDPEIRKTIEEIIDICDEFTVVSEYMKDYYASKIRNKKITVIPNYAPRMWFDRFYDLERSLKLYEKNIKRPRILVTGSGTHYDVVNANNQKDDYSHVIQNIIKTRKDFDWCFVGGHPIMLKPFIDNGEITLVNWSPLMNFAKGMYDTESQISVAALADNHFNRSKSSIKLEECGHLGIPLVAQNLNPYENAFYKFQTGDEMIDNIKNILKDKDTYIKQCIKAREYSDGFWLDDEKNLNKHVEVYTTPYGCPSRKHLLENNPEQAPMIINDINK